MTIFFFIVATWLLIAAFGLKIKRGDRREFDEPAILQTKAMSVIPWLSGFVLPVIPLALMINIHWVLIFLLNLPFVYIAGPFLTNQFLDRFATGRGLGRDMVIAFRWGIISLVLGLGFKYYHLIF